MTKKLRQKKWRYGVSSVFYLLFTVIGMGIVIFSVFYACRIIYLGNYGVPTQARPIKYYAAIPGPDSAKIVKYEYFVDGKRHTQSEEIAEKYYLDRPTTFTIKYAPSDPAGEVYVSIRDNWDIYVALVGGIGMGVFFVYLPFIGRRIDRNIEAHGWTKIRPACICGKSPKEKIELDWAGRSKSAILLAFLVILVIIFVAGNWGTNHVTIWDADMLELVVLLGVFMGLPFVWHLYSRKRNRHTFKCSVRYAVLYLTD